MMNEQIKKEARELYSKKEYIPALSHVLTLNEDDAVNFLTDKDLQKEWFQNYNFCNKIADDESLMRKLLCTHRADEILYKNFTKCWSADSKKNPKPFQLAVLKLSPELFVDRVRVTQSFLKNDWYANSEELSILSNCSTHRDVWKHISDNEKKLWNNVEESLMKFLGSEMQLHEVLIEITIAIEIAFYNDRNNVNSHYLGRLYSMLIQMIFSKLPKGVEIHTPNPEGIKDAFLKRINSSQSVLCELSELMTATRNWLSFIETRVDPYCFDPKLTPKDNGGLISFDRSSSDYYKWELDGKRYDINKVDYLSDARDIFSNQLKNGDFLFPDESTQADIDYEWRCQTQTHALYKFMNDLNLSKFPAANNLNSERIFQPLISASNMMRSVIENLFYGNEDILNWFEAYRKMYKQAPDYVGIDNLPFSFIKPREFYDIFDAQSKIEKDVNTKITSLCKPISYKPEKGKEIDRFNLKYDVFKKPFLKLGEFIFCPIHFLANNDWFYSISQNALELLDQPFNNKVRKETAIGMEKILKEHFRKLHFEVNIFDGHEFGEGEGDVDLEVSDGKDTILIQLKRTKMRLNLKDAYSEYINTDRKASRQINRVESYFNNRSGKKHKWIVTNSYENVYTEIDSCLKVNYFDLITILKSYTYLKGFSIQDLVNRITSDSQIKDILDYKAILEPQKLDWFTFKGLIDSGKFKQHFPHQNELEIYRSVDIPLSIVDPINYRVTNFALSTDAIKVLQKYNKALDADRNGDHVLAVKLLRECYHDTPDDLDVLGALANVLANMAEYEKAYEYFEKALKISTNDLFILRNYFLVLIEGKNNSKAIQVMKKLQKEYWYVDLRLLKPIGEMPFDKIYQELN
nr:hypothetical protein [uncultured Marinifilum sp.]